MTSFAQDRLASLLATAPVGIAFLDRDLRFLEINDALAAIHGQPAAAHVGRTLGEMSPAFAAVLEPQLRAMLETGLAVRELEVAIGDRVYLASYFPVRSAEAGIVGVGGMVDDITELRRALRAREDVLAVVSHDLRSPLNAIELAATMLGMRLGPDPIGRNHLAIIQRSSSRMRHMIDDLLDSASISEGRLSLQLEPEPADEIMREALDLQEALAVERGIRFQRIFETGDVAVRCDRLRILQVFGNLIGNSLKFCPAGGEVTVAARRRAMEVEFSVRDDGPGISPEVLPRLFDPYRAPPLQAQAGSGLGLHISKGIVERHGGRIWVDTAGTGTTFYFTLPTLA